MSVQQALKSIAKYAPDALVDDLRGVEGLTTGCLAVDMLTGIGGFPRGRITELSGNEGSGKTTIALHTCAKCLQGGLPFGYLDVERGLDLAWGEHIGATFDQQTGLYLKPISMEDTFKITKDLIDAGLPLIIIDSVAALVPQSELDGEITDDAPIAVKARKMSQLLPKFVSLVEKSATALVFINQMRTEIPTGFSRGFGPKESSTSGKAIRFYASLRLEVKAVRKGNTKVSKIDEFTGEEKEIPIASEHEIIAIKNRQGTAYRKVPFYIRYDEEGGIYGVDNLMSVMYMGLGRQYIKKRGGGYFTYAGHEEETSISTQGEEAFLKHLRANPAVVKELVDRLGLNYGNYEG